MLPKLTNIQYEALEALTKILSYSVKLLTKIAALLETAIKKSRKLGKILKILISNMYLLTPYTKIGTLVLSLLAYRS